MSIQINGIDLPKEDEVMVITVWGDDKDGTAFISNKEPYIVVPINAIQIPKGHGRLGDLDYLYDRFKANECPDENVYRLIREEPTILEAEE